MSRDLYIKANASAKEWVRPSDWLSMPTNITSADQIFVGLHAVIENSDNYCAFSFTTSAGQYEVDWGDGNVTLHNSNTIAQKNYDYASISNSTICSRGYKQVIITVTPVSGNLLTCNFQQRFVTTPAQNQAYSSGFLECILSMPNASSGASIIFGGTTIRHTYCEKVEIKTIGNATNLTNMFYNCYSLQSVPLFNTQNVTSMSSMFNNCYSLQSVPLFNTINVTTMQYMFNNCYSLQSVPLFNTINVRSMSSMLESCNSLQSVPLFNTQNVTNMSFMFNGCNSLQSVPLFNTQNVTNMSFMFNGCNSLQSVPLFNTQNVTSMSSMFGSCSSLNFISAFITTAVTTDFTTFANGSTSINRILMSFNRTVALQNCQLSKDALVEIFTNLTDRTSTTSATIDITGNWGATALTSADRLIATNKNWTITG
jgi:surface protein